MAVFIESVQNVIHHGHIDERGDITLYLTLENTPLGYQLHLRKLDGGGHGRTIDQRIGELNNLSHSELRKAYIDVLCARPATRAFGNAGLGVDLHRQTRRHGPIEFESVPTKAALQWSH